MGGYVFGVVARRLTTGQHAALFQYALPRLQLFTHHRIVSPRTAGDKTSHGDLDILIGGWVEGEGFKYNFAVDADEASELKREGVDMGHWRDIGNTRGHQWSAEEVKEWARSIATVLGARSWQNHQHGVSLAVPCDILGALIPDAKPEEFFQIDIRMIRPDRFDFAVFIMSYGITALLLAQAVRCLSPALVIHHEHLVVRHAPFPGQPPIEVELTVNVTDLLDWLGLDQKRWTEGFRTQMEYWRWIANLDQMEKACDSGGGSDRLITRAWKTFAADTGEIPKVKIRHQHPRFEEVERFREWLRTTYEYQKTTGDLVGEDATKAATGPAQGPPDPLRVLTYKITNTMIVNLDPSTGQLNKQNESTSIDPITTDAQTSVITARDSTQVKLAEPVPLDDFATATLDRFAKKGAYDAALSEAVAQAEELNRKRERRRQNREFSLQREDPAVRASVSQQVQRTK